MRNRAKRWMPVLGGVAGAGVACSAVHGQAPARVISSTFDAATSSVNVPGVGARTFSSYNGLFRSPNGERWIFVGNFTGDSATNRAIIAGAVSGGAVTSQGEVVVRKGGAIPGSTRTVNVLDNPRINDAGQFAFSTNSSGTGSPSVFFLTGSVTPTPSYVVSAAIGEPIPFLPGATYTGGFNSTLLDNSGRWGFAGSINESAVVSRAVIFNGAVVARSNDNATAPMLLPGSAAATWSDFTLRRVFVDATGLNFYWHGTVGVSPNAVDVAAQNNTAIAQEGFELPNSGGVVIGSFMSGWLEPGGQSFIRATAADNSTDLVTRNGQIVAKRNDPVTPGSTIIWDRVTSTSTANGFLFNVGNDRNDYVVCGNTSSSGGTVRSAAVVLNGNRIVSRRGDAVDVNGNGLDDDNAYIRGFKSETGPGTAFLTNDGWLWMVIDVENDAGVDLGDAIVRVRAFTTCSADFNNVGGVTVQDIFDFLSAYFAGLPTADFNGVGGVTVQDIFDFLAAYFAGCA